MLCLSALQKPIGQFRRGQEDVENVEQSGKRLQTNACGAFLRGYKSTDNRHFEM
jgi:hypothetical protein